MTRTPLEYASPADTRRSTLALVALTITAVAAAFLALAFLGNTGYSDPLGFLSLPLAVVGTVLTLVAGFRKTSRGALVVISGALALAYWVLVAVMIVPKLLAMHRAAG